MRLSRRLKRGGSKGRTSLRQDRLVWLSMRGMELCERSTRKRHIEVLVKDAKDRTCGGKTVTSFDSGSNSEKCTPVARLHENAWSSARLRWKEKPDTKFSCSR